MRRSYLGNVIGPNASQASDTATELTMRVNVHTVHPAKLNAAVQLCAAHKGAGHMGMLFVTHLYAAKVAKRVLGER